MGHSRSWAGQGPWLRRGRDIHWLVDMVIGSLWAEGVSLDHHGKLNRKSSLSARVELSGAHSLGVYGTTHQVLIGSFHRFVTGLSLSHQQVSFWCHFRLYPGPSAEARKSRHPSARTRRVKYGHWCKWWAWLHKQQRVVSESGVQSVWRRNRSTSVNWIT